MMFTRPQVHYLIGGVAIVLLFGVIILMGDKPVSYNQVVGATLKPYKAPDFFTSGYEGRTIEWRGKISTNYSQITGIKFCVIDSDHKDADIDKPCDWFWATSADIANADDTKINPSWDGKWVNYILNHYGVKFDSSKRFYDEVYTVKGKINGIDCGVDDKCVPDVEIISITK